MVYPNKSTKFLAINSLNLSSTPNQWTNKQGTPIIGKPNLTSSTLFHRTTTTDAPEQQRVKKIESDSKWTGEENAEKKRELRSKYLLSFLCRIMSGD